MGKQILLPSNKADVVSMAVRLVKGGQTMLPKPLHRIVSLPMAGWDQAGFLMGRAVALLDAPDSSILAVECVQGAKRSEVITPFSGTTFTVSNSPHPIRVDSDIVSILHSVLADVGIVVSNEPIENLSSSGWWNSIAPLVVEVSRIRLRGTPLFTPVVLMLDDEFSSLPLIAPAIYSLAEAMKVGVISTGEGKDPLFDEIEKVVPGRIPKVDTDGSYVSVIRPPDSGEMVLKSFHTEIEGKGISVRAKG